MSVKSFTLYKEYNDLIKILKNEDNEARLVYAIWKYMFEDEILELNDDQKAIFSNLKRPLDKSKNKSKNKLNKIKMKTNKNQNENTSKDVDVNVNVYVNLDIFINNNYQNITPYEYTELVKLCDKYSEDIVIYAMKIAIEKKVRTLSYIKGILKRLEDLNLKTLSDIEEYESKRNKKGKKWWEDE